MNQGFLRIPRSLLEHPTIRGLNDNHFRIFIYLLEKMCFAPCTQDDHGVLVNLQPGQFMFTYRRLAKELDVSVGALQRILARFESVQISTHKTIHTKTVLTFIIPAICNLFKKETDTQIDTTSIQDRYTKEETKNERPSFKKETSKKDIPEKAPTSVSIVPRSFLLNERKGEEIEIFREIAERQSVSLRPFVIARWFKKWGFAYVNDIFSMLIAEMNRCLEKPDKRRIDNPEAWMEQALKKNYIEMGATAQKNMELAKQLRQNGWPNLEVRSRFAVDDNTGKDFMYSNPEFELLIMHEYERVKVA